MFSVDQIKKANKTKRLRLKNSDAANLIDHGPGPFDAVLVIGVDRGRVHIVYAGQDSDRRNAAQGLAEDLLDYAAELLPPELQRRCRVCGCTQDDCSQCIEKTGDSCQWVKFDLCSACVTPRKGRR